MFNCQKIPAGIMTDSDTINKAYHGIVDVRFHLVGEAECLSMNLDLLW